MIEGHTFRALLHPLIRSSAAFQYHELLHNLSGPAFLFAAGVAFSFSSHRHWEDYRRWSPRLRARLIRWGAVLLLGYSLQLTYFSLQRTLRETTPSQYSYLVSLNVLQCIALSLFLLQLLLVLTPNWRAFFAMGVVAILATGFATPLCWRLAGYFQPPVGAMLGGYWGSVFPLFPYAGFSFAGAVWGHRFYLANENGPEQEAAFLRQTARLGLALAALCATVGLLPLPELFSDFWYTSPQFLFLRIGLLASICAGLRAAEEWLAPKLKVVEMMGEESLMIYALHLVVLYGTAWNPETSLVKWMGAEGSFSSVAVVCAALALSMALIAGAWHALKRRSRRHAQGVRWLLLGYLTCQFLLS